MEITRTLIINSVVINIVDDLVDMVDNDVDKLIKTYPNIPFEYYYTIEELAITKSTVHKDICAKAKKISNKFHKSIK